MWLEHFNVYLLFSRYNIECIHLFVYIRSSLLIIISKFSRHLVLICEKGELRTCTLCGGAANPRTQLASAFSLRLHWVGGRGIMDLTFIHRIIQSALMSAHSVPGHMLALGKSDTSCINIMCSISSYLNHQFPLTLMIRNWGQITNQGTQGMHLGGTQAQERQTIVQIYLLFRDTMFSCLGCTLHKMPHTGNSDYTVDIFII